MKKKNNIMHAQARQELGLRAPKIPYSRTVMDAKAKQSRRAAIKRNTQKEIRDSWQ